MASRLTGSIALAAAALLSACTIKSPPEIKRAAMCEFKRHHLGVAVPPTGATPTGSGGISLQAAIRGSYEMRSATAVSPSMLFLSGGSQHGAFGAGFLDGWSSRRAGGLPRFKVVTGISTGAILSTWAFINDTPTAAKNYALVRESQVLKAYAKAGEDVSTAVNVARRGAVGELSPLRAQLQAELTDEVLQAVASSGDDGRRLYVGAIDVDSGQAVAFDMTDMAGKFVAAVKASPDRRDFYRDCYADAIVASSSVPMAALPTFIDNRMYIDGGARFGLFSDEIGAVIDDSVIGPLAGPKPLVYMLVNGDLRTDPVCAKRSSACAAGTSGGLDGARKDWRFDEVAMRSVSILINQVYLTSVDRIVRQADDRSYTPLVEYILPGVDTFPAPLIHPELGEGSKPCKTWREIDERTDRPLEFHPRYMQCLIAYGRHRAGESEWHRKE